jgi:hypothetical protein
VSGARSESRRAGEAMSDPIVIDVAAAFSPTPGGRFRSEGAFSGEEFRQDIVEPKVDLGLIVIIDLDNAVGFTSSFLEEVFGGLVRKYGTDIGTRVLPRATRNPSRQVKALAYMNRAIEAAGGREARRAVR